jgi:hypothetical protein
VLKKLVVSGIAAGALAVSLAGAAGADPDPNTNPGTPGNFGEPPGQAVSAIVHIVATPGTTNITDLARRDGFRSIGQFNNNFAPGQQNKP